MTTKVKYLILGAGPSGLTLANRLLQLGETSLLVLEKEADAGGLCRSRDVDGSPLDIGGGHFLDVRNKTVLDFVFQLMAEDEWNQFDRVSKIRTARAELDYPYEANIWQLPIEDQMEHLMSIMNAGCNQGKPMPTSFRDWITWKLGDVIARDYMLPYNSKIFAPHLDILGTYWLYKLPSVSFEDTLRSCLEHRPYGNLPAHAKFYYPKKYGYGELFRRMADVVANRLLLNTQVTSFDAETLTVNNSIQADHIITTIPWHEIAKSKTIPARIRGKICALKKSAIDVYYRPLTENTDSHWTYFPDESLPYHRILFRHNFLIGSKGYWQEVNGQFQSTDGEFVHHNEYAYPLNTRHKPAQIQEILEWAKGRSIIGLGRWGEWEHMNSDIVMKKSLVLADQLTGS